MKFRYFVLSLMAFLLLSSLPVAWISINSARSGSAPATSAAYAAEDPTFRNSIGMTFVLIPAGTFMMGSPDSEKRFSYWSYVKLATVKQYADDEKLHQVKISRPFYMQTTVVTQGQWKAVMGYSLTNYNKHGDNGPVDGASWYDAQKFIEKLNSMEGTRKYRLPTEAEWEYAARAGTQTPFNTGPCLSRDEANFDGRYALPGCEKGSYGGKAVPVASYPPNAWGLYDMHGNVWQWVQDSYKKEYPDGPVTDPQTASEDNQAVWRVLRGGSAINDMWQCRSAYRHQSPPVAKYFAFRVVRTQ